jgi:uncharacterized protein YoxC
MQATEVAEFKQQLMAVANDLAVTRRDVEQLSSKHEQLSRDVATVQATLQNVSEKISPLGSLRLRTVRPEKASRGSSARKPRGNQTQRLSRRRAQGNQMQHLSRRRHRRPGSPSSRLDGHENPTLANFA